MLLIHPTIFVVVFCRLHAITQFIHQTMVRFVDSRYSPVYTVSETHTRNLQPYVMNIATLTRRHAHAPAQAHVFFMSKHRPAPM